MTNEQMKQISPVIDKINGWGDVGDYPVSVLIEYCGDVISFLIERSIDEEKTISGNLILTKIEYEDDLWILQTSKGRQMFLINAAR